MKVKAIALLSGGLDSTLAIKVMQEQDIEIIALNCISPFCQCTKKGACRHQAAVVSDNLGVELKIIPLKEEYLEIVKHPKHGYGKNLNPCIDCRILLFKKAKQLMDQTRASFVITGEVLGQRPMSQHRRAMDIIDQESGLVGLILRPLSAKVLPQTIPEKQGWVKREKLLEITGRSRKPQIELANVFGIKDYPCPAGGCLLTDKGFSQKVRDLIEHNELTIKNINLLKVGRHFRLTDKVKLIVGRDEQENEHLLRLIEQDDGLLQTVNFPGPISILKGKFDNDNIINTAASIVGRYSDNKDPGRINIIFKNKGKEIVLQIESCTEEMLSRIRV